MSGGMARIDSKQHLKNLSGHGCLAIHEAGRARIFAEAQHFHAGEMQAVLREASLGSLPEASALFSQCCFEGLG